MNFEGSHWADCWRSHHECAIAEVERLLYWELCAKHIMYEAARAVGVELCVDIPGAVDKLRAELEAAKERIEWLNEQRSMTNLAVNRNLRMLREEVDMWKEKNLEKDERIAELESLLEKYREAQRQDPMTCAWCRFFKDCKEDDSGTCECQASPNHGKTMWLYDRCTHWEERGKQCETSEQP